MDLELSRYLEREGRTRNGTQQDRIDRSRSDRRNPGHVAALKELGDIVLFDIEEGIPQGKALFLRNPVRSTVSMRCSQGRIAMKRSPGPTSLSSRPGCRANPG